MEREKKNLKGEIIKKPEITEDYNKFMRSVIGQAKFCTFTHVAGKLKGIKKFVFVLLHVVALNSSILFKKYTTNHNEKGKGYAFQDFMLDGVQKMTESLERKDEKDGTDDDSQN